MSLALQYNEGNNAMEEEVSFTNEDVSAIDGINPLAKEELSQETQESEVNENVAEELETKEPEKKEDSVSESVKEPEVNPFKEIEAQWDKKFSALSRRERFLSQKEKETNDRGRLGDSEKRELEELKAFQKKFKENPYGLMDEQGHTYENWTQKILAGEPLPVPSQVPNEIKDIRAELDNLKKERETQNQGLVQAQRQQVYQNQMNEINKFMNENVEKFPLINVFGDRDAQVVFDVMAEKYRQDATEFDEEYAKENIMSIENAAELTETWRENVLKERKIAIEPFRKKLSKIFEAEMSAGEKDKEALKIIEEKEGVANLESSKTQSSLPEKTRMLMGAMSRAKTLTNQQQTTVPAREDKPFKTEQERIDHAASFLRHS